MVDPLGSVFDHVFALIKDAAVTIYTFKSLFRKIETTFEQIKPIVKDMDKLNKVLGRPGKELNQILELMEKGKILLNKCFKIGPLNIYKKFVYSGKLKSWEEDIQRFFDISLSAITALGVKKIESKVDHIESKVDGLLIAQGRSKMAVKGGDDGGCIGNYIEPEEPAFVVGRGEQHEEVKSKLLQDGFSVVVVSVPGGCRKTTLVDKIFHDHDIRDTGFQTDAETMVKRGKVNETIRPAVPF